MRCQTETVKTTSNVSSQDAIGALKSICTLSLTPILEKCCVIFPDGYFGCADVNDGGHATMCRIAGVRGVSICECGCIRYNYSSKGGCVYMEMPEALTKYQVESLSKFIGCYKKQVDIAIGKFGNRVCYTTSTYEDVPIGDLWKHIDVMGC